MGPTWPISSSTSSGRRESLVDRDPWPTLTTMFLVAIFAILAVVLVVAFAAQISRRRRYERGEYDPDDV